MNSGQAVSWVCPIVHPHSQVLWHSRTSENDFIYPPHPRKRFPRHHMHGSMTHAQRKGRSVTAGLAQGSLCSRAASGGFFAAEWGLFSFLCPQVINIINAAQESSPVTVAEALERVLEILRTTELYSPQLASKEDDPHTNDLVGGLMNVRRTTDWQSLWLKFCGKPTRQKMKIKICSFCTYIRSLLPLRVLFDIRFVK